ncbi:MAG: YciI family protein [Gluconacetobacter diazotrophicus]|nr:YciI family protein [Gluconacetobacter diazotrophicus]
MLFSILCLDRPDGFALRGATRDAHLAWLDRDAAALVEAGPLLDDENRSIGSLLIVDLPDREAAERFAAADPYAAAELFASVTIRPYRSVFRGGARTPVPATA